MKEAVYEELDHEMVPAFGHGEGIFYRIFYGTVTWRREPAPAFVIFMQYGNEDDWGRAKAAGQISFQMPAHLIHQDVDQVKDGLERLKSRIT